MRLFTIILLAVIAQTGLMVEVARADELVMKTGERFTSDHVWEENGKIRFNLQGLLVSVDKNEVAAVIREEKLSRQSSPTQEPHISHSINNAPKGGDAKKHLSDHAQNDGHQRASDVKKRSYPDRDARRPFQGKRVERGTGLKGIVWKMKPEAFAGLVKIETEPVYGGIDHYSFPQQSLKMGEALLDGISYGFWSDQLYSVMMWVDGRIGYRRFKDELFQKFGTGSQNKPEIERYIWLEEKTQRMLEFDTDLNMGIFVMRSSELDAQIKKRYPN